MMCSKQLVLKKKLKKASVFKLGKQKKAILQVDENISEEVCSGTSEVVFEVLDPG
jgi:hypothetical protein